MENIFLIKWYGPFASLEDVKQWENEQTFKCSLYLLHGKEKYAKTSEKYYCGMSIRSVNKRLCDKGHHIEEIQARLISIYVGCLAHTDNPSKEQVKLAEKVITANLTYFVGADNVLNAINTYFPSFGKCLPFWCTCYFLGSINQFNWAVFFPLTHRPSFGTLP